ncbi:MAG: hypothetical protein K6G55_07960 [Selenomonadaceae bacterium]|nr:hypothetical protein [Selenomonadaceae bacterium]
MKRLAKNLILATAVVSAIFFVGCSCAEAAHGNRNYCMMRTDRVPYYNLDFWSKFRDTVMPDEPQDNNPPKEMRKPAEVDPPKERHRRHKDKPKEVHPEEYHE